MPSGERAWGTGKDLDLGTSPTRRSLRGPFGRWVLAVLACGLLVACGGKSGGGATQVAAKVNKEEISLHQVNYFLQRQPGLAPDQTDAASRQTLESLVDQALALQAATEQRIDRDPAVMQALEAARRDIIVRAYAEHLTQGVQAPSTAEVAQYYDSHPALFAKRRLYTLVDTAVVATPAQQKTLRAQLPGARSAADVAALLQQAGLRFATRHAKLGAEALPMQAVDAMGSMRDGQSQLVAGPHDAHILTIVSTEPASLSEDEARAAIEGYLTGERKRQALQQQIKALRSSARIEYSGRFAQPADNAQATPAAGGLPALSAVSLSEGAASLAPSLATTPSSK
jgi:EpsD family peptidyl-prolyl cis-trans isomerase